MLNAQVTEESIFQCFAAAQAGETRALTAESFVDVEEYENAVMYPEFARWARQAGYPKVADLFLKVAGEEKLHSVWLRALYARMGTLPRGEETKRAIGALAEIRKNSDTLIAKDARGVVTRALKVAIRVEQREYREIYPRFRDQAIADNDADAAAVYQRVIDSEKQHAGWFEAALSEL